MEEPSKNDIVKNLESSEGVYAVEPKGPLLLLSGPGTGKTHDLARRVHWLLFERNPIVSKENILVVTFTAEAARNMIKRMSDRSRQHLDTYVPTAQQPKVATLHSLGQEIISKIPKEIGLSEKFNILPRGPIREILISDCAQIRNFKRKDGKNVELCRTNGDCRRDTSAKCDICDSYISLLRSLNIIDHDDQIFEACKILRLSEKVLAEYKTLAMHLLVDEYQDINQSQHELINLIVGSQEDGFFAVGDDDQSIYEFRGGSLKFIKEFEQNYGKNTTRTKILSRRCSGHILCGSLDVIDRFNPGRLKFELKMLAKEEGDLISIHRFPTDEREATFVAWLAKEKSRHMEVLILVPNLFYAAPISSALLTLGVNHNSPFRSDKTELGFFITLENWLNNNMDSFALRMIIERMIESGYLGIPTSKARKKENIQARETSLKRIGDYWKDVIENRQSLYEVILGKADMDATANSILESLKEISALRGKDSVEYFRALANYFDIWHRSSDSMIQEFKRSLSQADAASATPSVRIMSMQGAKGLEADCVIIIGLDERVLPRAEPGTLEEAGQSRLLFVSMTRAKSELHLCHSANRSGARTFLPDSYALKISRFLKAISEEHRRYVNH